MKVLNFTKAALLNLSTPTDRPVYVYDKKPRGLGIRITKSGVGGVCTMLLIRTCGDHFSMQLNLSVASVRNPAKHRVLGTGSRARLRRVAMTDPKLLSARNLRQPWSTRLCGYEDWFS